MPPVSQAQRRLMHGIASGSIKPKKGGPSRAVAQEFAEADPGGKLPARAGGSAAAKGQGGGKKQKSRRAG